jgi:hypothetical protein
MRTAAFVAVLLAVAGVVASEPALAGGRGHGHRHSHVSIGVGFGFGYPYWGGPWGPWGYPYPYYSAPTVVVQQPVTYVEQNPQATSAPAADAGWWYYCDQSKGYYPYVRECPTGWQRVPPTPSK